MSLIPVDSLYLYRPPVAVGNDGCAVIGRGVAPGSSVHLFEGFRRSSDVSTPIVRSGSSAAHRPTELSVAEGARLEI